jgi:hypothetical protein
MVHISDKLNLLDIQVNGGKYGVSPIFTPFIAISLSANFDVALPTKFDERCQRPVIHLNLI